MFISNTTFVAESGMKSTSPNSFTPNPPWFSLPLLLLDNIQQIAATICLTHLKNVHKWEGQLTCL